MFDAQNFDNKDEKTIDSKLNTNQVNIVQATELICLVSFGAEQ